MKTALLKVAVAFVLSLLLSWAYLFTPQVFFSLDDKLKDFMFILRGELPKNNHIVIIDIDEKSLQQVGQWPWSRDKVAEVINKLSDSGAGIIGLDIVFSEPDRSSPHKLAKAFPQITDKLPNYDEVLAKVFSTSPVVGGYVFTSEETMEKRTPFVPAIFIQKGLQHTEYLSEGQGIILNIPSLQNALYSSGFFVTSPDEGGMVRNVPLIKKYKNDIYPSLALEMLRIYSQSSKVEIVGDDYGVQFIIFGDYKIPTGKSGELIINFRGQKKHFPYISAADILNNNYTSDDIKNKFVLIGTSAQGLKDLRSTPFSNVFPGVEVHANIIDNILQGDFLQRPEAAQLYDLAIIWILVFFLIALLSYVKSWLTVPLTFAFLGFILYLFYVLLFNYGIMLTLISPILTIIITLIISIALDYFLTSKQKEDAIRLLGKKVSKNVMNYLLKHSDEDLIAAKEVEATIFFSDIRGFTTISEQIGSPNRLIALLNSYMTPMVDTIIAHEGTIDKFIGDAIMAYWNTPLRVEDHADKALQCAIKQIDSLKEINHNIHTKYQVNINIGIGIHTGLVTAGDMGAEGRSDYTIIGDNVNIASRLENLTKLYGAQILISKATYLQLKQDYSVRPVDIVAVKGKSQAIEIFEVLCETKHIQEEELKIYNEAITLYRDANLREAYALFTKLTENHSDKLYTLYMQRCKMFIDSPDLEFTPVFTMTSK